MRAFGTATFYDRHARICQSLQAGRPDVDAVRCAVAAHLFKSGDGEARRRAISARSIRRPPGVLPIALGRATRLLPLIEDRRKAYACTLVFGRATDTGDAAGETDDIVGDPRRHRRPPRGRGRRVHRHDRATAADVLGRSPRRPPAATSWRAPATVVERAKRSVTIFAITVLGRERSDSAAAHRVQRRHLYPNAVRRSRAGLRDGRAHGCAVARSLGTVRALRKPALEEVAANPAAALVPPERVIPIPTVVLDGRKATDFRAGRVVAIVNLPAGKHVFVRDSARSLVGVGETVGALLAPRRVFD